MTATQKVEPIIVIEKTAFFWLQGYYENKSKPGIRFVDRVEIVRFVYSGIVPDQTGRH